VLTVVGVMAAQGAALESEVWADLDAVRAAFARTGYVSSVRVRLTDAALFPAYQRAVESDPRMGVSVQLETTYMEQQAEGSSGFITGLGGVLCFLLSVGAMLGAMITMYAAVAKREREIGTLRALGFGKRSIVASFVIEAGLLGALGGIIGASAALALGFVHFSVVNAQSWNETVFSFEPTWNGAIVSVVAAIAMGVLGGLLPAIRAARLPLVRALRA
jgi:putative ABC transport system permease protein